MKRCPKLVMFSQTSSGTSVVC